MCEVVKITNELVKEFLPERIQNSNKGTFGKVLNIAGSFNYQGAAYLSSAAPLKVGAGLVSLATIETVINNLASTAPWITFLPLKDYYKKCIASDSFVELKEYIDSYSAISIGPGISDLPAVGAFVDDVIKYLNNSAKKVVLDADALNIIAKTGIVSLPQNTVITPHPMEMSRLLNVSVEEIQNNRVHFAKDAVKKYDCTVVLKGNKTLVALKDGSVFENTTGNSSLAKAGSGDVLTGIISGFMAQGLDCSNAAILGVYLHGLCGEIASKDLTEYSVMATDQINSIPLAIKQILAG